MNYKSLLVLCSSIFAISFSLYSKKVNPNKKELDTNVIVRIKDSDTYTKDEMSRLFFNELTNTIDYNYRKLDEINGVFNFVSLKVNSSDIEKIEKLETCLYAYEEIEYYYDPNDPDYNYLGNNNLLDTNYSSINMNIGEDIGKGENTFVAILDSALNYNHEAFQSIDSSLIRYSQAEINLLTSDSNFNGKNYRRINDKVPFTYDYCNDDDDVLAKDTHGSHVASLSIGNGRYKGIAPQSQLAFMKVFNDYGGGCTSVVYLKALEDCYLLNVDAVNMSFGSALNYTKDATDRAVDDVLKALKEKGTNVYIASGNDGRDSFKGATYEYSLSSNIESGVMGNLALNEDSITVANSTLKEDISNVYALIDKRKSISINDRTIDSLGIEDGSDEYHITDFPNEYRFADLIDKGEYEYVLVPNKGSDEDYKDINVQNKIAVVERGELPFTAKIYYAIKNGASGLIIYNQKTDTNLSQFSYKIDDETLELYPGIPTTIDENGDRMMDLSYIDIPIALVDYESGNRLNEAEEKVLSFYREEMSLSSSMGASADLSLKPDIVAPGEHIYGAYTYYKPTGAPTSGDYYLDDAYYFLSGTSMATPNLMGAYVSLLSSYNINSDTNREAVSKSLRNRMLSNTTLLYDESGTLISPRRQGNGLVNVDSVYNSSSYLLYKDKNQMELGNDYKIRNGIIDDTLTLIEERDVDNYQVSIDVLAPKLIEEEFNGKNVKLYNSDDVLLESKVLYQNYQSQSGENEIPIYFNDRSASSIEYLSNFENGTYIEGYITLKNENKSLHIPFLGFYGDYHSLKPYEDFSFEKEPDKVYESDIMDDYIRENYDLPNVYTGSYFLIGENEKYYERNILPSSFSLVKQYRYMEYVYDEESGIYHIYTGEYPDCRGLIIQLFMLRSVVNNEVTLFDDSNNVLETFYFKDSLFDTEVNHELYRNYILLQNSSLMNQNYFTHRSYCYIPLVLDDGLGRYLYENGTYNLLFEFELVDGYTYSARYILHLGENYLAIPTIYDISLYNNLLRVYVKEKNTVEILINNKEIKLDNLVEVGIDRYYFEINIENYINEDIFIEIINDDENSTRAKFFYEYGMAIAGLEVNNGIFIEKEERNNTSYYLNLVDNNGEIYNFESEILYGLVPNGYFVNVLAVDNNSTFELNYQAAIEDNDFIRFNTSYSSFLINNELKNEGLYELFFPLIIVLSTISGLILIVFGISGIKYLVSRKRNNF